MHVYKNILNVYGKEEPTAFVWKQINFPIDRSKALPKLAIAYERELELWGIASRWKKRNAGQGKLPLPPPPLISLHFPFISFFFLSFLPCFVDQDQRICVEPSFVHKNIYCTTEEEKHAWTGALWMNWKDIIPLRASGKNGKMGNALEFANVQWVKVFHCIIEKISNEAEEWNAIWAVSERCMPIVRTCSVELNVRPFNPTEHVLTLGI